MKIIQIAVLLLISSICLAEGDMSVVNNSKSISALKELLAKEKFYIDNSTQYPGAPSEEIRLLSQQVIDAIITALIEMPKEGLSKVQFWGLLEQGAMFYQRLDSEEMDRGLTYMENIMDIYGIESSDGRLNIWRYGFDPKQSINKPINTAQ